MDAIHAVIIIIVLYFTRKYWMRCLNPAVSAFADAVAPAKQAGVIVPPVPVSVVSSLSPVSPTPVTSPIPLITPLPLISLPGVSSTTAVTSANNAIKQLEVLKKIDVAKKADTLNKIDLPETKISNPSGKLDLGKYKSTAFGGLTLDDLITYRGSILKRFNKNTEHMKKLENVLTKAKLRHANVSGAIINLIAKTYTNKNGFKLTISSVPSNVHAIAATLQSPDVKKPDLTSFLNETYEPGPVKYTSIDKNTVLINHTDIKLSLNGNWYSFPL